MKGIICYYSGSGNTKLACEYLAKQWDQCAWDLYSIRRAPVPDFSPYAVVVFATFTDFVGVSRLVHQFLEQTPLQQGKPAIVLNTYGFITGQTLKTLAKLVAARGFSLLAGHTLHTPESYPPMIARGKPMDTSPSQKEMDAFQRFIDDVNPMLDAVATGTTPVPKKISIGVLNSLIPTFPVTQGRKDMGEKFVDSSLCTKCGTCEKQCPYEAIQLRPLPVFNMERCYGCWACFNHCPRKAIYTGKVKGRGHYPKPAKVLVDKLT